MDGKTIEFKNSFTDEGIILLDAFSNLKGGCDKVYFKYADSKEIFIEQVKKYIEKSTERI